MVMPRSTNDPPSTDSTIALSNEVKSLKAELSKLKASDPDALPGDKHMWQEVFLALTVCNVVCYAWANDFVDGLLGIERVHVSATQPGVTAMKQIDWLPLIMLLPLVGLMYQDLHTNASKKFLAMVPDKYMNYILRVAGGYGIVQVLAQDLGEQSGINQRNVAQHPLVLFVMLWGGAFSLTGYRSEGMVAALLYFVLKYNVSGGLTTGVCFEDV